MSGQLELRPEESRAALAAIGQAQELASLASQAEQLGRMASVAYSRALVGAVIAGIYLLEARESVGRGDWGGWLELNWSHSRAQAYYCEKVAKDYLKLQAEPERLAFFGQSVRKAFGIGANVQRVGQTTEAAEGLTHSDPAPDIVDADYRVTPAEPPAAPGDSSPIGSPGDLVSSMPYAELVEEPDEPEPDDDYVDPPCDFDAELRAQAAAELRDHPIDAERINLVLYGAPSPLRPADWKAIDAGTVSHPQRLLSLLREAYLELDRTLDFRGIRAFAERQAWQRIRNALGELCTAAEAEVTAVHGRCRPSQPPAEAASA